VSRKKKIEIVLAEQDYTNMFQAEIGVVLRALGHPEALVTDMSTVSDFFLTRKELKSASKRLGVPVLEDDYVWGVARRIRMKH
jgi:hypothetical protein